MFPLCGVRLRPVNVVLGAGLPVMSCPPLRCYFYPALKCKNAFTLNWLLAVRHTDLVNVGNNQRRVKASWLPCAQGASLLYAHRVSFNCL